MDKDFWHERWKKKETGFHLKDANPFLRKHWGSINASPQDTVFVPLCGKSKDLIWLAERVQNVIGVELSQQATEEFFS
jgi:thiopurine S-methyltransferase